MGLLKVMLHYFSMVKSFSGENMLFSVLFSSP